MNYTLKINETINIDLDGKKIVVRLVEIDRNKVRIGVDAPGSVLVGRSEVNPMKKEPSE